MSASALAMRGGFPGGLPLDTMELDLGPLNLPPLPAEAPTRQAAAACQEGPADQAAAPAQETPAQAAVPAQAGPSSRRPLARFVQEEDSPVFYISLSDLMCLLLVFFVLIFSLSSPEHALTSPVAMAQESTHVIYRGAVPSPTETAQAPAPDPFAGGGQDSDSSLSLALVSLAEAGQTDPGLRGVRPQGQGNDLLALVSSGQGLPSQAVPSEETSLGELVGLVKSQVAGGPGLEVESGPGKVVLRLPEAITFDLGRAEVKPAMAATLARLAQVLAQRADTSVVITGHTDDLPIATPQFASNWELSAARAAAVGRALMAKGIPQARLTIRGLADQQPRVPNQDAASRQQNRRVEIELRPLG